MDNLIVPFLTPSLSSMPSRESMRGSRCRASASNGLISFPYPLISSPPICHYLTRRIAP